MGLGDTLDGYEKHRPHQVSNLGTSIHQRFSILTEVFRHPVRTVHGDTLNTTEIRRTEESFFKNPKRNLQNRSVRCDINWRADSYIRPSCFTL
jgi:plastocyanin domain-containing protein